MDLAPRVSEMGVACTPEALTAIADLKSSSWPYLLATTPLSPGCPDTRHHYLPVLPEMRERRVTHVRVNLLPDGGVARFELFGNVDKNWSKVKEDEVVDLVSITNGYVCPLKKAIFYPLCRCASINSVGPRGKLVSFTNAHYGTPLNLLLPSRSKSMAGGWETSRNPNRPEVFEVDEQGRLVLPGEESCVIMAGTVGRGVVKIEVDTNWYKGNFPESVEILVRYFSPVAEVSKFLVFELLVAPCPNRNASSSPRKTTSRSFNFFRARSCPLTPCTHLIRQAWPIPTPSLGTSRSLCSLMEG